MPAGSGMFPALNLFPLNDSFVPKHIVLAGGQHVKIGRQTNAKTLPGEKNGYFDSKVLSRQHAEVWEDSGKIYIKDVKSSNGTFINGTRLSQEGVESAPFELNTDDIVEFGIDIVGEDNQTIIHHKVAAKVQCLLSQDDVNAAQQHAAFSQVQQHNMPQPGHMQQGQPGGQRRPSLHGGQTLAGSLGALAPVPRLPSKNGLSFDVILSRLQNEVQRSRETSAELQSLTATMSEIHDSLGGVSAQPIPAYPHILPAVRNDSDPGAQLPPPIQDTAAINTLQEQLHQTQSLLSTHVEKIHSLGLEGIAGEHDGIKREIGMLRDLIDQRKLDMSMENGVQQGHVADDDDNRSVATLMAGDQYSDEENEEDEEDRRRRRDELGRPRTPEPSMGMEGGDSDGEGDLGMRGTGLRAPRGAMGGNWEGSISSSATHSEIPSATRESVEHLTGRLEQLAAQFEMALAMSRELQEKQIASQEQIASLQAKVDELEASKEAVPASVAAVEPAAANGDPVGSSVVSHVMELTKKFEGRWETQREEWEQERERLKAAKEEWERRVRRVEEDLSGVREVAVTASTTATQASSLATISAKDLAALVAEFRDDPPLNDGGDQSEFAPPSPRSISSDVLRNKKRRTSGKRRSRSSSPSPTRSYPNGHAINDEDVVQPYSPTSLSSAPYSGNGKPGEPQNYGNDSRRLPGAMKGVDTVSRTDSMSSSSAISTSERKPDIPLPYMSAAATMAVALIGVAAWTAANHIHA